MTTEFATKLTPNKFCYHLVGFQMNVLYDTANLSLVLTESDSGALLKVIEKDEDLDFDTFVLVSKNILTDLCEVHN